LRYTEIGIKVVRVQ